jgi:hypothetical protein
MFAMLGPYWFRRLASPRVVVESIASRGCASGDPLVFWKVENLMTFRLEKKEGNT